MVSCVESGPCTSPDAEMRAKDISRAWAAPIPQWDVPGVRPSPVMRDTCGPETWGIKQTRKKSDAQDGQDGRQAVYSPRPRGKIRSARATTGAKNTMLGRPAPATSQRANASTSPSVAQRMDAGGYRTTMEESAASSGACRTSWRCCCGRSRAPTVRPCVSKWSSRSSDARMCTGSADHEKPRTLRIVASQLPGARVSTSAPAPRRTMLT